VDDAGDPDRPLPQWPIRLNSFKYIDLIRDPTQLTIFTG
jgi:hypothetical protein